MLIEYTVKNFRSFRDEVVLSMVADKNRELADTNTFQVGDTNLLKVAALYGSNASGKSNLIESFRFFGFLFRPGAITKKPFPICRILGLTQRVRTNPYRTRSRFS